MYYFQQKEKEQQSKDAIFDMNRYLTQHILEHLPMYNIKYSYVAQYIIYDNTTELKTETLTRSIFNPFRTENKLIFFIFLSIYLFINGILKIIYQLNQKYLLIKNFNSIKNNIINYMLNLLMVKQDELIIQFIKDLDIKFSNKLYNLEHISNDKLLN